MNGEKDRIEHIVEELARIAFGNLNKAMDLEKGTLRRGISDDTAAAIASVVYKPLKDQDDKQADVKFYDKLKALELLGKHYSMFGDKKAADEPVTISFVDDYGDVETDDKVE